MPRFTRLSFLYGCVLVRALDSFPTRRSSDLPRLVDEIAHELLELRAGQRHDEVDRKSTRLNSSHANISYAVFCLNKKRSLSCSHTRAASSRTPPTAGWWILFTPAASSRKCWS